MSEQAGVSTLPGLRRIEDLAGILRQTDLTVHADIVQALNDAFDPPQPGIFKDGDPVRTPNWDGHIVQGIVRRWNGDGTHQVWFPGQGEQPIRTDRLEHGRPMPHIPTSEGVITDPILAEKRLIATASSLQAAVMGGRAQLDAQSHQSDSSRLCGGLAAWHGVSARTITNRLRSTISNEARKQVQVPVRIAARDIPRGMAPIANRPSASSASGRPRSTSPVRSRTDVR